MVRHGETTWNIAGRRQGQLDSPLTDTGRGQAAALAAELSAVGADGVFSSPRGRARATATPIAEACGLPLTVLADLREIDHGSFAGYTSGEIDARWPGSLAERDADKYEWRFPGGESYRDADQRAGAALVDIAVAGSVRPIIVTHEMLARMLFRHLLGLGPDAALRRRLPHGTVAAITPDAVS